MKYKSFLITLLVFSTGLYSQVNENITAPRFIRSDDYTTLRYICIRSASKTYDVAFSVTANINGIFQIELSGSDGSFSSPQVLVSKRLTGAGAKNLKVNFSGNRKPYGEGYKIRVKTISSGRVSYSKASEAIPLYFITNKTNPILRDKDGNTSVYFCGASKERTIVMPSKSGVYQWYKDDVLIPNESSYSLTVTKKGAYYAKPVIGGCNVEKSTILHVYDIDKLNFSISNKSEINLCSGQKQKFVSSVHDDENYKYVWYKDGVIIDGATDYTYITSGKEDQFGKYVMQLVSQSNKACTASSSEVVLKKSATGFAVNLDVPKQMFLLGKNAQVDLKISYTVGNASVQWFYKSPSTGQFEQIKGQVSNSYTALLAGDYYAKVTTTENISDCPNFANSDIVKVLQVDNFKPVITVDSDYSPCESNAAILKLETLKIIIGTKEYVVPANILSSVSYKWSKKTASSTIYEELPNFNNKSQINLNSNIDNGSYQLIVNSSNLVGESNVMDITLLSDNFTLNSSSSSNSLCPGSSIKLSVSPSNTSGVTYEWFKEDEKVGATEELEVSSIGKYKLIINSFGCEKVIETEVKAFNDNAIKITPQNLIVVPGGVVATASGGDSYEWRNDVGELLSSNSELNITEEGEYTLTTKVGTCVIVKKVGTVLDDGKNFVQNIISPFDGDGVNDTWILPNRFTTTNVRVIIYNSSGKELLNTTAYQNDWPKNSNIISKEMIVYYRIIKNEIDIKAGALSILK